MIRISAQYSIGLCFAEMSTGEKALFSNNSLIWKRDIQHISIPNLLPMNSCKHKTLTQLKIKYLHPTTPSLFSSLKFLKNSFEHSPLTFSSLPQIIRQRSKFHTSFTFRHFYTSLDTRTNFNIAGRHAPPNHATSHSGMQKHNWLFTFFRQVYDNHHTYGMELGFPGEFPYRTDHFHLKINHQQYFIVALK